MNKVITFLFILILPLTSIAQWESINLPEARNNLKGISKDENLYFVGGKIVGGQNSSLIDVYNTVSKEWSIIQMPDPAFGYDRSIEFDNKLFIQKDYSEFLVYNLLTEEWTEISTPISINNITKNDSFLIISDNDEFSIYIIGTNKWETFKFSYRSDNTLVATNEKIIIAGGSDGGKEFNLVEIFDIETKSWLTDTLSIPRDEIKSIAHNDQVFFIGGEADGFDRVNRIDIYNLETRIWSIDSFDRERWDFDLTIHNDKLYIAGGQVFGFSDQFVNNIDIYNLKDKTWDKIKLPTGRSELSAIAHRNKIYFAGGRSDQESNRTNIIDIYSPIISNTFEAQTNTINCSPNPTKGKLQISKDSKFQFIKLFDTKGNLVIENQFTSTTNYQLDVSYLTDGIFFLTTDNINFARLIKN